MAISREPDTRPVTYLRAFFTDMLTGMSGPLSVPFAALALWASGPRQKILYGLLALLCLVFASYRVWRKERIQGNALAAQKDSEITGLRDQMASLVASQQKPKLTIRVSAEGNPPSQVLKVVANRPVTVSRVEYMVSTEASIAGEDVSAHGESLQIPITESLLTQVWNIPRADRNFYDGSGPAKIGITISEAGHVEQYILPIQMQSVMQGSTLYRKVIASKTF